MSFSYLADEGSSIATAIEGDVRKPTIFLRGKMLDLNYGDAYPVQKLTGTAFAELVRKGYWGGCVVAMYKPKYRQMMLDRMIGAETFYKALREAVQSLPAMIPDDASPEEATAQMHKVDAALRDVCYGSIEIFLDAEDEELKFIDLSQDALRKVQDSPRLKRRNRSGGFV